MYNKYPYTDFHELNLDYILKLVRESIGLGLKVTDKQIQLVNDLGEVVSSVTVSFAKTAEQDEKGRNLTAYLFDAGIQGRTLVVTKGDGTTKSFTIPYAEIATNDDNGNKITSYLKNLQVSGNQLTVTLGDGSTYNLTVPFATEANHSKEADHTPEADHAKEADHAERADKDSAGSNIRSTYAVRLTAQGDQLKLEAADGTQLSLLTVPFATLSEDANNAIESVRISGNQIVFTTYDNVQTSITVPYALKAVNDVDGDAIVENYVASVRNNAQTGEITFYAKDGSIIAQLTPTVDSAVNDSYGNNIAEYIKNVVAQAGSDYVVFTKGTGDTVSIKIDYSNRAWKDTNDNIIANTYIAFLNFIKDTVTGEPWLVAYNGETAELFRLQIDALSALKDDLGNIIKSTYAAILSTEGNQLKLESVDGKQLSLVTVSYATKAAQDDEGSIIKDTYGNKLKFDQATNTLSLLSKSNKSLSTITIESGSTIDNYTKEVRLVDKQYDGDFGSWTDKQYKYRAIKVTNSVRNNDQSTYIMANEYGPIINRRYVKILASDWDYQNQAIIFEDIYFHQYGFVSTTSSSPYNSQISSLQVFIEPYTPNTYDDSIYDNYNILKNADIRFYDNAIVGISTGNAVYAKGLKLWWANKDFEKKDVELVITTIEYN